MPDGLPDVLEVVEEITIEAPPQRVWEALATPEALRRWFEPILEFDPRVGGRIVFSGLFQGVEPYHFGGTVTVFDAPNELSFEWDDLFASWPAPTVLTIRLTAVPEGTRVRLSHHGWERLPASMRESMFRGFERGWDGNTVRRLKEVVEQGAATW